MKITTSTTQEVTTVRRRTLWVSKDEYREIRILINESIGADIETPRDIMNVNFTTKDGFTFYAEVKEWKE